MSLFHQFADVCEQLAATSSRLQKAAVLQAYLATLDDDDLPIAARFFSGSPFALRDARVLNVGGAVIRDVVVALTGITVQEFGRLHVQEGEAGAAAEIALAGHVADTSTLTLRDVKKALATLDVVVTAAEVGNGNRRRFLSDYTFAVRASADDPTLLNVGKAYSGLTDPEVATLTEWFNAHTIQDFGRVKLVEPQIVLEVAFDVVQPSARHKSGYALRFPRIVRIRDDKTINEIDTLQAVRALAEPG